MDPWIAVSAVAAVAGLVAGYFLNRRRRLQEAPVPGPNPRDLADDVKEALGQEPRPHHYTFAHVALPQLFFEKPEGFTAAFSSDHRTNLVRDLWQNVGDVVVKGGRGPALPPAGVAAVPTKIGRRPAVLFRLPEPGAITECWFTIAVLNAELKHGPDGARIDPIGEPPAFYFTLECGCPRDGRPRTVLCSWNAAGTHANFGDGPAPDASAFAAAVGGMIDRGGGKVMAATHLGGG